MTITVTHSKVSAIPDGTDTSVVRPSDWNATHTLVGVGTAASLDAGVANGVATLDSGGQVPLSQLPPLGDLNYQGAWNANTNSPTLTSSTGTKGYYYVVSVAGTTNLNGITDWQIGDWAVFNGSVWQKIDNTDAVTTVNGYTGTVVLTQTDISGTVPTSRTITAGTGLTGGGDLSANRTLAIATTGVSATTYGSASSVPVIAVNTQGQITSATNTTIAIANTAVSGLGTMSTQNANNVTITGGSLNAVAIGQSTAGDGSFDVLTANVTRLTNVTSSAGIVITGTFTGSSPTDGLVMDYATGWGRFSDFGGDGFQWFNAGLATTKLMELSSTGALTTTGTVTANGVLLTGNLGTVTSVTGTAPVVSSGGTTPAISMAAANTTTNGYLTSTDWNTFNGKSNTNGTVTSVAALTLGTTGTDLSSTVANGTTTPVITLQVPTASATNRGALSAADWTTFNNKGSGTVTSVGITAPSIFTVGGSPVTGSGTLALTYSGTALPLANGGTGATSAPAANASLFGFTTTATSATPLVLTNTSSVYQLFTGSTAQTVTLPVTSTLTAGWTFHIVNNSTQNITVNSSGANLVCTVIPNTTSMVTCILITGTTAASWEFGFTDFGAITGTGSVVMSTSPTLVTPVLGTPASGTVTNLTGTASININGTVGATTASTGAFTTLTASTSLATSNSGTVSLIGTGAIAIGATTATTALTVGQSTVSQTTNIQAGATASASTKAINIGTGGLAGSTTTIIIGSTAGTSTTTVNGTLTAGTGVTGGIAGGTF